MSADCTNKNLNGGNQVNNCAESWHSTFTISQTLSDIPAGTYELRAQGFYQQDGDETEKTPVFFLGSQEQEFHAKGTLADANGNGRNDMSDASVAFSDGDYTIEPVRFVLKKGESLTLGVRGTAARQWVIFDNFRLTYLGSNVESGIISILTSDVEMKDAKYLENGHIIIVKNGVKYNVSGQRR